jgi:serine/threonine-protein kinase
VTELSAPADLASGIRIGTVLDRYEIVRHVARGGMGSIWLGKFAGKHGFTKQVAIKTIAPEYAENPQFHAMFLEEARISSKLAHANVAQVLDVGEYRGSIYIVFEWVDGQSLGQICSASESLGAPVPAPFLLRVLGDACAGLHAVHELADERGQPLGVVHRDITPSNILVSEAGFSKVIDFGIAKARDRVQVETRSGFVKGTPEYMSPEHASKELVDRRADVWSLGAVLFRGLAGAPPFRDHDALLAYIEGRMKLPALPKEVPPEAFAIVAKALQVDRTKRFASAEEMRAALEKALHTGKASSDDLARMSSQLVNTAKGAAAGAFDSTELALPTVSPRASSLPAPKGPGEVATLISAQAPKGEAAAGAPAKRAIKADPVRPLLIAVGVATFVTAASLALAFC